MFFVRMCSKVEEVQKVSAGIKYLHKVQSSEL